MKIKSLELKNFRPYYGDVKAIFPTADNSSICLIHGLNGYGKTSLFMALNWCLYGHEKLNDVYEFFNIKARAENNPVMSVKMILDDDAQEVTVLRRIQCNRQVRSIRDLGNSDLSIFENGIRRQTPDMTILQEVVNSILPREASQFSFFDGEKIEIYSSDNSTQATQDAISSVLGLSLLARSKEDLEKISLDINRDRRRLLEKEENGTELAKMMEEIDNNVEEAMKQKDALEEKCKSMQTQELSLQDQLVAQEAAQTILEDIKVLQGKINEAEKSKRTLTVEIKDATRTLYYEILEPVLIVKLTEAQRTRDNLLYSHMNSIKRETAQALVEKMQQSGICICGRPLDKDHLQAVKIALELPDQVSANGKNSNDLDEAKIIVSQLEASLAKVRERESYAELAARLAHIENDIDEWATSLAAKKSQLGTTDEEAIASLAEASERVKREKGLVEREIGSLEQTISDHLAERKKLESKISQISGQVQGLDLLSTQVDILNRSSVALGEIVRRSALAKQGEIQEKSTHFFRNITNKAFEYESMIINPDFSFGVETTSHSRPPMSIISAGEKQVTALSFILGLNEYTQREAPIFMDTPMGRLDETHRRNVAKVLLEMAQQGRQIILLATDTDIAFGVYDILKPAIGAEFEIVHNQTDLTSSLKRRA